MEVNCFNAQWIFNGLYIVFLSIIVILYEANECAIRKKDGGIRPIAVGSSLRGSATQNRLIFQLCFIMPKLKLYVCRILCENFSQIGQKMKKL